MIPRPLLLVGYLALAGCRSLQPASERLAEPTPIELHSESFGSGDPIVLLHGLGGTRYTWRHLASSLSQSHRVILVDLKGHGRSPKPRDGAYSLFDQADLVHDFILENDLRNVTLVGNSYGGGVALVTALRLLDSDPERLDRLILLDTIAYEQRFPFYLDILRVPLLGPLSLGLLSAECAVKMVLEKTYHDDDRISPGAIREYARALREPGGRYALVQIARQVLPANADSLVAEYPRIDVPTLILWGREDEIIPLRIGRRLEKALPDARLYILPDCGHAPQEECPGLVLPLVTGFLEASESP